MDFPAKTRAERGIDMITSSNYANATQPKVSGSPISAVPDCRRTEDDQQMGLFILREFEEALDLIRKKLQESETGGKRSGSK